MSIRLTSTVLDEIGDVKIIGSLDTLFEEESGEEVAEYGDVLESLLRCTKADA